MRISTLAAIVLFTPAAAATTLTVNVNASNGGPLDEPLVCMRVAGTAGTPRNIATAIDKSKPRKPEPYLTSSYRTAFQMPTDFGQAGTGYSGDVLIVAMASGHCPNSRKVSFSNDVPDPPQIGVTLPPLEECPTGVVTIGPDQQQGTGISCTSLRKKAVIPSREKVKMPQQSQDLAPGAVDPRNRVESEPVQPSQRTPEGGSSR